MAKILAVDDEPAILEMIESILNKDGHLVTKVSNPLKLNMEELHRYTDHIHLSRRKSLRWHLLQEFLEQRY